MISDKNWNKNKKIVNVDDYLENPNPELLKQVDFFEFDNFFLDVNEVKKNKNGNYLILSFFFLFIIAIVSGIISLFLGQFLFSLCFFVISHYLKNSIFDTILKSKIIIFKEGVIK